MKFSSSPFLKTISTILGVLTLAIALHAETAPATLVPDEALAKALREQLGLDEDVQITESHLKDEKFVSFSARSKEIEDISGIEHATFLRYLDLYGNSISDISPLASLTEVQYLDLSLNNDITDASDISPLVKLNTLSIAGTKVSDLNFLANIAESQSNSNGEHALEILYFGKHEKDRKNYGIIDISILSNFPKLNTISGGYNRIGTLAPLSFLTNETKTLKFVSLYGNYIDSISSIIPPLNGTSSLEFLDLSDCYLASIYGLETNKFPLLTTIFIERNFMDMADLAPDRNIIGEFEKIKTNTVIYREQFKDIWKVAFAENATGGWVQNKTFFPDTGYQYLWKELPNIIYSNEYDFIYFPYEKMVFTGYFAYFFNLEKWVWLDIYNMPHGNGTVYTYEGNEVTGSFEQLEKLPQ